MRLIAPLTVCAWAWAALAAFWLIAAQFVNPTKSSESLPQRMQHVIPLLVGFCLIFDHRERFMAHGRLYDSLAAAWAGAIITIGGILLAMWSRVTLGRYWSGAIAVKEDHRLIRTGPYRFVHHPLYSGFLTAAAGSTLTAATVDALIGFVLITTALVVKLRREEAMLAREFNEEYRRYQRDVRALVPFLY